MKKIPSIENGMRTPTFEKNLRPNCFLLLLRLFLSKILSRRCRISRTTSDPAKKVEILAQNCVFPVFPAKDLARFCHAVLDFREHQGLPPD